MRFPGQSRSHLINVSGRFGLRQVTAGADPFACVFVDSNDGRVYGLDLASGNNVWEYEAASPVTSSPAVVKGKVVVATADGQVICFG